MSEGYCPHCMKETECLIDDEEFFCKRCHLTFKRKMKTPEELKDSFLDFFNRRVI